MVYRRGNSQVTGISSLLVRMMMSPLLPGVCLGRPVTRLLATILSFTTWARPGWRKRFYIYFYKVIFVLNHNNLQTSKHIRDLIAEAWNIFTLHLSSWSTHTFFWNIAHKTWAMQSQQIQSSDILEKNSLYLYIFFCNPRPGDHAAAWPCTELIHTQNFSCHIYVHSFQFFIFSLVSSFVYQKLWLIMGHFHLIIHRYNK